MRETPTPLHFQNALQIAHLIVSGEISSRKVTEHFLERIARAPELNVFTQVFAEQALAQADAADAALLAGGGAVRPARCMAFRWRSRTALKWREPSRLLVRSAVSPA